MGHGAAAASVSVVGENNGAIPKVDVEKMPLLSPYQLGPFHLSHRYVVLNVHGQFQLRLLLSLERIRFYSQRFFWDCMHNVTL